MKLQEVFDQLAAGEFSQISVGGQPAGTINESNYSAVLGHINLGMTSLYKRFNLKVRSITFPLQADSDTYQLNLVDLLKIEKVVTDGGCELGLNQEGDTYSCSTPSMNSLRVPQIILDQGGDLPDELKTVGLTVSYRANHPKLSNNFGALIPETKSIELPSSHLQALLYFVASRVHNPIGMVNEFNAGNVWFSKYELECQRLETENLQIDKPAANFRLHRNGWV